MATAVLDKRTTTKKATTKDNETFSFEKLKQFIIADINNDIEDNAKYIISYFNNHNIEVTNLKLQKLL